MYVCTVLMGVNLCGERHTEFCFSESSWSRLNHWRDHFHTLAWLRREQPTGICGKYVRTSNSRQRKNCDWSLCLRGYGSRYRVTESPRRYAQPFILVRELFLLPCVRGRNISSPGPGVSLCNNLHRYNPLFRKRQRPFCCQ